MENFFYTGKNNLPENPEIPSCIFPQYLWYIENIQVDCFEFVYVFRKKNINYNFQLFQPGGSIKIRHELETEHELHGNVYFQ